MENLHAELKSLRSMKIYEGYQAGGLWFCGGGDEEWGDGCEKGWRDGLEPSCVKVKESTRSEESKGSGNLNVNDKRIEEEVW